MHTYEARVIADQATGRPLAGIRVTVEDAETGAPVQPYRDGAPVQLVTGAHGLITEWQTEEPTRRVAVTAGPVRLTQWCEEIMGAAGAAADRVEAAMWPRGPLLDSNLNAVTTPGTYWQSTSALATLERGYPRAGMTLVLRVEQAATAVFTQEAVHYDSTGVRGVWRRSVYTDGRVTEWKAPAGTPEALGTRDLGTVIAPGPYYQSASSNATVERGYPKAGMLGALDVKAAASSIVTQTYTHYDSTGVRGVWHRTVYADGRTTDWAAPAGTPASLGVRDLATVIVPGPYYQSLTSNATIARGYPRDGMTGTLDVKAAASSLVTQELTHYDSGGVKGTYRRTVYADGRATEWTQTAGTGTGSQPAPVVPSASPKQSSRRGPVILRFDDGLNGLEHAAEYMGQYGLVGYHAACSALTPHDSIRALHTTHGWEIGNHVAGHESEGSATFLARVDEGSRVIADLVGEYPTTFTYPRGHRSPEGDREMALRFNQIQLTSEPHTSAVNLAEPSCFSGWTVVDGLADAETQGRAFERMKRYVVGSTSQGLVPTIAFHEVAKPGQTPTSSGTVSWELFTSWIDWLASEGFETILPRMLRPAQLVVDPGFNAYPVATFATGAYPWAASSLAIWSRSTTHQYSGLGCLRSASSTPVTGTVSQGLALEPGREYRVHVLANVAPTAGAVEVELRPRLMDGRYVGATIPLVRIDTATSGFTDRTITFTMPAGTQNASLFIRAVGLAGTAVVDHVSIMRADLHDPLDPTKP